MARHAIRNPLLLPELFYHILDYIDVLDPVPETEEEYRIHTRREPSRATRKALFALAQTCRAISEPSLDRLWRVLGSLVPLIRSFAQVADLDRAKTPPSPAEWAIIHRYAVRVRELLIESETRNLSLHFVQCTGSQSHCLLPNSRVLVWDPIPNPPNLLIERLLVSGLVSLDICIRLEERDSPRARRLFKRYANLCPNLKVLRWIFDPSVYRHDPALSALSDSILRLRKIDNLELSAPLDPIALKHVILSPDYKTLGIMLNPPFAMKQIDITPADTPFPNVETMELKIWDLDFFISLLRPHRQMFRTLVFKLRSVGARPLIQSMLSCFTALATPQRINSVQSIDIRDDHRWSDAEIQALEDAPMNNCITYETLSPLMPFRCFRELQIMTWNWIDIDDDELVALARSWPSLEVLYLSRRSFGGRLWVPTKYVTLRGLLTLIAGCPALCRVSLTIDARVVPTDASPDICNTALRRIAFPGSHISEPRLVADFFRKHLPRVKYVGSDIYMEECYRMWMEVDKMLRL